MKTILLNQEISNYAIDENGHVFNTITNTELNGSITLSGYKYFRLCHKGKQFRFYAHRLVAEYYLPNDKSLQVVNHKNGYKLDNRIENLRWAEREENIAYMIMNRAELNKELTRLLQKYTYEEVLIMLKNLN